MSKKNLFLILLIISMGSSNFFGLSRNEMNLVNGSNNNQISPSPRWGHDMVYDPINKKIILFGGYGIDDILEDTWIYDYQENTWTELVPSNIPSARHSHKMEFGSQGIILFGGYGSNGPLNDIWFYNITTNNWIELLSEIAPNPRMSHAMTYDLLNQKLILFSGYGVDTDTWTYDFSKNTWKEEQNSNHPTSRYGHTFVYDSINQLSILFGGHGDDTWTYNSSSNEWREMSPSQHPCNRYWHTMTYDSINGKTIVFGGSSLSVDLDDTWIYDYATNNWMKMTTNFAPPPRSCTAFVYDSINQKAILFGGSTEDHRYFNDMWMYDYELNEWLPTSVTNTFTNPSNTPESTTSVIFSLEIIIIVILAISAKRKDRRRY